MNHFDLLAPVHGLPGNGEPDGKLVTVDEGVDGVDGVDIDGEEDVEYSHASTWLPYHKFAGDLQTMTGYVGESPKEDVGEAARTEDEDVGVTTWGPVQEAARSLSGESGDVSTFLLLCERVLTAIGVVGTCVGATTCSWGESAVRAEVGGGSRHGVVGWARFSSNARFLRLFRLRLLGRTCFRAVLETPSVVGVTPVPHTPASCALQRKEMDSTPFLHSSTHFAHSPFSKHWR